MPSPNMMTSETTLGTSRIPISQGGGQASKQVQQSSFRLRWRGLWNVVTGVNPNDSVNDGGVYAVGDVVLWWLLRMSGEIAPSDPVQGLGGAAYEGIAEGPAHGTWFLRNPLPYVQGPNHLTLPTNTAPGNDGGAYWQRIDFPPELFALNGQDTFQSWRELSIGMDDRQTRFGFGLSVPVVRGKVELKKDALYFKPLHWPEDRGPSSPGDEAISAQFGPDVRIYQNDGNTLNLNGQGLPLGTTIAMSGVYYKNELGETKYRWFLCTQEVAL